MPRLFEHKDWRIKNKGKQEHKKILGSVLNKYLFQGKRYTLSQSTMNEHIFFYTLNLTKEEEEYNSYYVSQLSE